MSRRKWVLVVLLLLLGAGYYKLFYKTYSERFVASGADCIVSVDVKRVANTVIWQFITTPSRWKKPSISSSKKIGWEDMFSIPDYAFIFHLKGQPAGVWHLLLDIKDEGKFAQGLPGYGFAGAGNSSTGQHFFSAQLGLRLTKQGSQALITSGRVADSAYAIGAAKALFLEKNFSTRDVLSRNTNAASHLAIQYLDSTAFNGPVVITADFDKEKLRLQADVDLPDQYSLREQNFTFDGHSLFTLGFTQPPAELYRLLPDSSKARVTRALNFDIDSLLRPGNTFYQLDLRSIQPRLDSAVTYTYDDDFNPVEQVVVNNVNEPMFRFRVTGNDAPGVYDYFNRERKIEATPAGALFTPMPFVKAYCRLENNTSLQISSAGYSPAAPTANIQAICFLKGNTGMLPGELRRSMPDTWQSVLEKFASFRLTIKKTNSGIHIEGEAMDKDNNTPIIDF